MAKRRLQLGIIGLGQIGGSIAAALKASRAPYHVSGQDRDDTLVRLARRLRLVQHGSDCQADLIESVDILVVALPMLEIHRLLREQRRLLRNKVLVMDTGSTKKDVIRVAEGLNMKNFVGGHPYAGTEKSAPAAWDSGLFADQLFFVAKSQRCDGRARSEALRLVRHTGAVAQEIDPDDHDRMFAFASGLPHILAYALVASQGDRRRRKKIERCFLAHSFASSTRVAKSPPETIAQFLWQNRRHLKREIDILKNKLDLFAEQLSMKKIDSFLDEITGIKALKDRLE